ncbi:MAG: His/Gly/Thr/Pro-type tRNA ligase C-terminal domain-containing protein, partial [Candidatus Dormibacteraeota bacterium]|nr:His/Gly/Thr/Pro-type tRNA ligase C-terminal domain-containing protein [Candidatus Dormibacteraeota bacterium]
ATVQFDFNEPERFELEYIGVDGAAHRPIMVHRTILGSMERFFGVLLEHYAGALPIWLSPIQVRLLPITDDQQGFCRSLAEQLSAEGFRADVYDRPGRTLSAMVREGQLAKIPYLAVVGRREVEAGTVALRDTRSKEKGKGQAVITPAQLIERLREEVAGF